MIKYFCFTLFFLGTACHAAELAASDTLTLWDLDSQTDPGEADISEIVEFDDGIVFVNNDVVFGREIWRSDGTQAGTTVIIDLEPGKLGSRPEHLTPHRGWIYFTATSTTIGASHIPQIWRTDGTREGTEFVASDNFILQIAALVPLGEDLLLFSEFGGIWRLDANDQFVQLAGFGTSLDIRPYGEVAIVDDVAFFRAWSDTRPDDIFYISDGTTAGTTALPIVDTPMEDGQILVGSFEVVGSNVFFAVSTQEYGRELWVSDGSVVRQVVDLNPGPFNFGVNCCGAEFFAEFGDQVVFVGDNGSTGYELWLTDGTAGGTRLIKDLDLGGTEQNPRILGVAGGLVYFDQGGDLWSTDGSNLGTRIVSRLYFKNSIVFNDTLYLTRNGQSPDFWGTDGTALGTVPVLDVRPTSTISPNPTMLTVASDKLWYLANADEGNELFVTDGTFAGSGLVKDLGREAKSSNPRGIKGFNSGAVMVATVNSRSELRSVAADGAVTQITDQNSYHATSTDLVTVGSDEFYFATRGSGSDVFRSDGTQAGTDVFADVNEAVPTFVREVTFLKYEDGQLLVAGEGLQSAGAAFSVDGNSGFVDVLAHVTDVEFPRLNEIRPFGDEFLFGVRDDRTEVRLTSSAQSSGQTILSLDGAPSGVRFNFLDFGAHTYFIANDSPYSAGSGLGIELWRTNGTVDGTEVFLDIWPGPFDGRPRSMGVSNNSLIFAGTRDDGDAIFASDGTSAGTAVLRSAIDAPDGEQTRLATSSRAAFFSAPTKDDGGTGLWASDGTVGGTLQVADLFDGPSGASIYDMKVIGKTAFFSVKSEEFGEELWRSDGTVEGTMVAVDLVPGPGGSQPLNIQVSDGDVWFSADDGLHGRELWRLDTNIAPWLEPLASQTIVPDQAWSTRLDARDADPNDTLSIAVVRLPPGAAFSLEDQVVSWTPDGQQLGSFELEFSVTDLAGLQDTLTIDVLVLQDQDGDLVADATDNCLDRANPTQVDADQDGFGNACDADFNGDCVVNVSDLGIMRTVFFSADAAVDLNEDGVVNVLDLGILRTMFFAEPGPSALAHCPDVAR